MKKEKRTVRIVEQEPEELVDGLSPKEIKEEQTLSLLQNKITEFQAKFGGRQFYVYVSKWDGEKKKFIQCERYPDDEFDSFMVRDTYGPGLYQAWMTDEKWRYIPESGYFKFEFAESVRKPNIAPPASSAAPVNPMSDPIVAIMMDSQRKQIEMLSETMKATITAIAGRPQAPGMDMMTTLDAVVKIMAMKGGSGGSDFMQQMQSFASLKKLFEKDDSGGEGGGGLMSEIAEFAKFLPAVKEFLQSKGGLPMAERPAIEPQVVHPQGRFGPWTPVMQRLEAYVPDFETAARNGAPVKEWAGHLVKVLDQDLVPIMIPTVKKMYHLPAKMADETVIDMIEAKLIEFSEDPDTLPKIIKVYPVFGNYQPWMVGLLKESRELIEQGEAEPEQAPPAAGEALHEAAEEAQPGG